MARAPWDRERLDWFGAARHDGGEQETSSSSEPWEIAQPYLRRGYEALDRYILSRPTEYFPESTVVPFAPETEAALGAQTNRALMGNPLVPGAQAYTGDVLSGRYLSPETNPFLSNVTDAVMAQVMPQVQGGFGMAGHGAGSSLAGEAIGQGVSRGLAPYLFGEYGRERGYQEAAAQRAPMLAREDYFDIGQLGQVGSVREQQAQRELSDEVARWNYAQQEPAQRAQSYISALQGLPQFGTTTGTAQQNINPWLTGAGLGLQGASIIGGFPTTGGGSVGGDLFK